MGDENARTAAPVLSTPDDHILEHADLDVDINHVTEQDEAQIDLLYEVQRTVREIRARQWKRIALQFPDHMLPAAPRVFQALSRRLRWARKEASGSEPEAANSPSEKLFILADTSYGACCVDEVAAEHADADVVVHYGRSCLTPTARLPVIYVYTTPPLDLDAAEQAFADAYADVTGKIILMADVPYQHHLGALVERLRLRGYEEVFVTSLVHDTLSPLPNRTTPAEGETLRSWKLFHVATPPDSLLLTLSSRVESVHIYPANERGQGSGSAIKSNSAMALKRRYATLVRLSTVPIFGILINTLSVKNYMNILAHVKKIISDAGKKSYTFVVGKVNAAKVANFSEVGGWVVIGCWESSLFESKDFWKPVITPFELELALKSDSERVWTGEWSSDFQAVLRGQDTSQSRPSSSENTLVDMSESQDVAQDEDEDEPPEFDFRTGQYVSNSKPMRQSAARQSHQSRANDTSLVVRARGDLATIGGVVSPAAEFLKTKRTWQGLGSDFAADGNGGDGGDRSGGQQGASVEEGRRGIAKGYTVSGHAEAQ